MSSRRSRSRQSGSSRITDDQIVDLVSKLQTLLPEIRNHGTDKVSASKVLQETCNYIKSLHREVDDLSERLAELLATTDTSSAQAAIIRSLLMLMEEVICRLMEEVDRNTGLVALLRSWFRCRAAELVLLPSCRADTVTELMSYK
ncbi:hypothetical protein MRB53_034346 [Persea americana]|uniref:Uncharacterized protein n=1 Tax=Persea americana TaxID=3435 RepID=A0ACC2KXB5_PERAE|nr:hypothetical protein MRB53_034346 [Persea americana]